MASTWVNPVPMGTNAALGQSTDAMRLLVAKAYGSRGGRMSARRRKKTKTKATKRKRSGGRKLKFGSKAYRAKYLRKGRRKSRK